MIGIAKAGQQDRSDLIRMVAGEKRVQPAIVEKDFWVCYLLDYLFHRSEFKGSVIFKGGNRSSWRAWWRSRRSSIGRPGLSSQMPSQDR